MDGSFIWLIAALQSRNFWTSLTEAVENNATLALLGLIVAAFGAGFGVSRLLKEHRFQGLTAKLSAAREELKGLRSSLETIEVEKEAAKVKLREIHDCLTPDGIRLNISNHLRHWPAEHHDLLLVALIRQLLATPGGAWLCTPAATAFVKVEFDRARGACKVSARTDSQSDPIKDVRDFVKNPESLKTVLLELALYGNTTVAIETGPNTVERLLVRQGPGLDWHIEKQTLERLRP